MAKQTTGEFLALLRKANGFTQQEVAEKLNISNRTLSSWETDRTMPDLLLLPAIADLYGVTVDELLRGERTDAPKSNISDSAKRAASKNRFGKFSAKAALITGFALCSALIIELGCILFMYSSSPAWVDAILWALGAAGIIACISCLFYLENSLKLAEGVVLGEDYTVEKKAILFSARNKVLKAIAICALPFFASALIFLLAFAVTDPQDFQILNVTVAVREAYIGVFLSNFTAGILISLVYLVLTRSAVKTLANERQTAVYNGNAKLLKKICSFGIIPFGALSIILLAMYIAFPEDYKTVYESGDFATFRDYMQTLVISEGEFLDPAARYPETGEYLFSFPEAPEQNVTYDLGNGFGGHYWDGSAFGEYWVVTFGEEYPRPIWYFYAHLIDTPDGEASVFNVRYNAAYYNDEVRIIKSGENYVLEENISDTLQGVKIPLSFGVTVSTVTVCAVIYGNKHKKQSYEF